MKRLTFLLSVSTLLLVLTGCSPAPPSHDADIKAIKDIEAQWNKDFAAKDVDKVVSYYTDDAVFMMSGMPAASGKAAIQKIDQQALSDPAFDVQFESTRVEVSRSGTMAYSLGNYTQTMTDPMTKKVVHDKGTYVTVYVKQPDKSWKAVADAPVSEMPPPAPPAPPAHKRARHHRRK